MRALSILASFVGVWLTAASSLAAPGAAQSEAPPPLPRRQQLPVSGLVAGGETRALEQVDAPGRRSLWIGTESGGLEAWVYPLKVLRDLRLRFDLGSEVLDADDLARRVEVRPEWTAITYVHEAFSVRQIIAAPHDRPLLLALLEVDSSLPLTIEVTFQIDLHPMWPAGLGGQYSGWDAGLPGFALGDGSRANAGVILSPAASDPTVQPAHSLPDAPTRFRIDVRPEVAASHWYPIVVGAWTHGMQEPADAAGLRRMAAELAAEPGPALQRLADHYLELTAGTVRARTPEPRLDAALAWATVRLDQGLVCNPHLGCGLIAGYGPSGAGYRPGFAWFFGGDAFYNSWALGALGAHETVRQALQMLADNQRDDGKIMHELSQGAGTLRWFEDYPYGFYHAETTPWFIDAVVRHARATGDLAWARAMWPGVLRALAYCRAADGDGDGLMENTIAGLGAVEMGALRELRVHQDVYLASVWTRAIAGLPDLARALGDIHTAELVAELADRAVEALETRLGVEDGGWAFAIAGDGSRVQEPTVWNVLPASLGVGNASRAHAALRQVAAPEITTDWGTRMLSSASPLYDPLIYNQGTVWPFLTGFAATAAYRYGHAPYGKDLIDGLVELTEAHSRGAIHEVLSGDRFAPMTPSVPHQLFSTASLATATITGLFGVDVDRLGGRLRVAPQLPFGWETAELLGVRWGDARADLRLRQRDGRIELDAMLHGEAPPPDLDFAPWLPVGAVVAGAQARQRGPGCRQPASSGDATWIRGPGGWQVNAAVDWSGGLPFEIESDRAAAGERSRGWRVVGCELAAGVLRVDVAGPAGTDAMLRSTPEVTARGEGVAVTPGDEPATWKLELPEGTEPVSSGSLLLSRSPGR